MSTEIMNYEAEFAKIAEQTKHALTTPKINYLSVKGKIFTLPDGKTTPKITCVVLDFVRINVLLPPYNPNIRPNPKCWAIGRDDAALAPPTHCPAIQATICTECPNNKFGTATNGGRGKACANQYRLAIVAPDATITSDISMVKISPTGLDRWRRYVVQTESAMGSAGFCRVTTEISFDPNRDYPSLLFHTVDPVKNPEIVLALQRRAAQEILVEPTAE